MQSGWLRTSVVDYFRTRFMHFSHCGSDHWSCRDWYNSATVFKKLVNQGMILGESFRYYDDNTEDDPHQDVSVYSFQEVEIKDEGPVTIASKIPFLRS